MKTKQKKSRQRKKPIRFVAYCLIIGLLLAASYYLLGGGNFPWGQAAPPPGRMIENTAELQIALARSGFSPGSIDGNKGRQTQQALAAFQQSRGLPVTGEWEPSLDAWLRIEEPTHAYIELTATALAQLTAPPANWRERGQLSHLGYHSALEMVAEKTCTDPTTSAA